MTAIYDNIGAGYDRHRCADPVIVAGLAQALGTPGDGRYLDLACGSGNYTVALSQAGYGLSGLDISSHMLLAARRKSSDIGWVLGGAGQLPFASGTFAGAVCTLAIHHFADLSAAFAECRRVLRSGAPFVLFTGEAGQMRNYWLNTYFPKAMARSIAEMPGRDEIEALLRAAGFVDLSFAPFDVTKDLRDRFLYSGKHEPGFYLDADARASISTFAKHDDEAEIRQGAARLRDDIASGYFEDVRRSYDSGSGDYLFVSANNALSRS
jgi:SAM-dependent methyltransferase